jgi:hypothetical protein
MALFKDSLEKYPYIAIEPINKFYMPLHLACEFGRIEMIIHLFECFEETM